MRYISTRGHAPEVGFETAILDGLAPDGGLYVPRHVMPFSAPELAACRSESLTALNARIFAHFAEGAPVEPLLAHAHDRFTHPAITPLVQIDRDRWVMELFHGPTLAFKDLAMQALAPLMGHFLARAGRHATILGATSGDTGGAALAGFADVPGVEALFLYPEGGVSPFQAAQMQALSRPGLRAVPVRGSFDDCQRIVKSILAGAKAPAPPGLTAVNSVNWGRILAQSAYYARAALLLGSPDRPVHFVVPTGNFGNLYAGLLAKRLGFAVGQLVVATNANDSLHRIIENGTAARATVARTLSPAMDIRVPSNLERLIFDLAGDAGAAQVRTLYTADSLTLPPAIHQHLRALLRSESVSDAQTLARIRETEARAGYVPDPHTAVGLEIACRVELPPGEVVTLATAHPVKFAETVTQALGAFPAHLKMHAKEAVSAPPAIPPDEAQVRALLADAALV